VIVVDTEIAWAAAWFEGEGCVSIRRATGYPRLTISTAQHGSRVELDRFVKAIQCGRVRSYYRAKFETTMFQVHIHGAEAHKVMELLRPFLTKKGKKLRAYEFALREGCRPEKRSRWGGYISLK
jgi:hypothetical protein